MTFVHLHFFNRQLTCSCPPAPSSSSSLSSSTPLSMSWWVTSGDNSLCIYNDANSDQSSNLIVCSEIERKDKQANNKIRWASILKIFHHNFQWLKPLPVVMPHDITMFGRLRSIISIGQSKLARQTTFCVNKVLCQYQYQSSTSLFRYNQYGISTSQVPCCSGFYINKFHPSVVNYHLGLFHFGSSTVSQVPCCSSTILFKQHIGLSTT